MSVQRIVSRKHCGWQARAHVWGGGGRRLTRYVADSSHGGKLEAYRVARVIEAQLFCEALALRQKDSLSTRLTTTGDEHEDQMQV